MEFLVLRTLFFVCLFLFLKQQQTVRSDHSVRLCRNGERRAMWMDGGRDGRSGEANSAHRSGLRELIDWE